MFEKLLKKENIKFIGLAATLLGFGATFVTNWVEERTVEEKIKEEVIKAIAEKK